MSDLILLGKRLLRPPPGAALDTRSQLTKSLKHLIVPQRNEFQDYATNKTLTVYTGFDSKVKNFATSPCGISPNGPAFNFDAQVSTVDRATITNNYHPYSDDFTVGVWITFAQERADADTAIMGIWGPNGAQSSEWSLQGNWAASSTDYIPSFGVWDASGNNYQVSDSTKRVIGRPTFLVGVKKGSTIYFYRDGIVKNSAAAVAIINYDTINQLRICSCDNSSIFNTNASVHFAGMWSRALNTQEIKELARNPWQMFKAQPRRLWPGISSNQTYALGGLQVNSGTVSTLVAVNTPTTLTTTSTITSSSAVIAVTVTKALDSTADTITSSAGTIAYQAGSGLTFSLTGLQIHSAAPVITADTTVALDSTADTITTSAGTVGVVFGQIEAFALNGLQINSGTPTTLAKSITPTTLVGASITSQYHTIGVKGSGSSGGSGLNSTLNWTAVSGAEGYFVHYGLSSGTYDNGGYTYVVDVGNTTSFTIPGASNGQTYYFSVQSYSNSGANVSDYSTEYSVTLTTGGGTGTTQFFTEILQEPQITASLGTLTLVKSGSLTFALSSATGMAASAGTLLRNATKALLGVSATFNFSNNLTFVNNPWLSSHALQSIVASMGTAVVSQVSSGSDVTLGITGLQVQTIANANAIVSQSGFQCSLSPLTATIGNVTASHATPALAGVYATSTTSGLGGLATSRTLTSTTGVTSASGALGETNSLAISAPSSSIILGAVVYGKGFQAATNLVTSGTSSTLATETTLQTTSASAINTSSGALARAWLLSLSGAQTSATPGLVGKSFGFLLDDAGDIVSEGALTLSIEHSPVTLLGAAITSAPGGITGQNSELLTGVHATASPGALSLSTTITPNGLQIAITKGNFLSLKHSPATLEGTEVTFSSSGIAFNNNLTVNGTQIDSASSNLNYTNSFIGVLTGQSFTASAGRTNALVNGVMHLDIFGESVMVHAGGLIFRPEMGGNTSATGGYLLYHDDLNSLTDSQLQNFLHDWIAGITGFAAGNVRPRWQVEPGNLPDVMVDWIAFGITSKVTQGFPFLKHVDSTDFYPNGHDELHSHRRIKVLITIYGPNAERTEMILSRGAYVAQNREPLGVVNIGLVGCGDSTTIPEFIKQQWMMRVDLPIEFNQEVILDYNVLNILSSGTTITTEAFVNVSDATPGCEVIK